MARLSPGDPAPDFGLLADDASRALAAELAGERIVLYFYPKDDTSGCTVEACEFRDAVDGFDGAGARVVGVSPDSQESHDRFRAKNGLTFPLLSDPDHALAEAYGVWVEKKMYGRTYMGIERSTFVIGSDGVIEETFYTARPKGHAAAVLARVAEAD